jgi:hypothetical protein
MVMKAITLPRSPISTSSNMKRSLRPRSASSTVLYCVLWRHERTRSHRVQVLSAWCVEATAPSRMGLPLRTTTPQLRRAAHTPAHGQHRDGDAVELVKAAPRARLREALVDLAHGLVVHLVAAVKHVALHAHRARKVLDGLRLARACVCLCVFEWLPGWAGVPWCWCYAVQPRAFMRPWHLTQAPACTHSHAPHPPAGPAGAPPSTSFCACVSVM